MRSPAAVRATLAAALAALACHVAAAAPPPPAPGAARYGEEPKVTLTRAEARALDAVRARLGETRVSAALVLAARELAALAADGAPEPLSRRRLRAALARAGAYDPAAAAVLVVAPPAQVARAVARSLPRERATHLGAGAVERGGDVHLVLLASERRVRLAPFPREVAPGAAPALAGALGPGLARARVFVASPAGDVREAEVTLASGFRAAISFPAAGRYVVEVVADGRGGPEVAALLVVSAGGAPLESAASAPAPDEPAAGAEAEARVVRAVNATRRRHGLRPLAPDPALGAVARRHSAAMAGARSVAHVLPGSGDVGDRLRLAGVPYRRAYENVARAGTSLDAHEAGEESPAHLANVLRPEATRLGVGIARARLPSGDATVYLTEVFVEPPDDGADGPLSQEGRAREALWRERARLGLPPLTADPALEALAREAALSLLERDSTEATGVEERALARRRGLAAVDVFVASAPAEVVRSTNLRDGRFRRVGVGMATGDSRRFGAARLFVVVVYTD